MLSKENYDRLNTNLLYKTKPSQRHIDSACGAYHCKNWTFKVHKYDDCTAYMLDTYFNSWDSHKIQVTDENIDQFEIVFDCAKVKQISDYEVDEYYEKDIYRVATNSGGYSCGHLYWVNKDAKKSKEKLIKKSEEAVRSAKWQLEHAERELQELLDGTHYKLKYCE